MIETPNYESLAPGVPVGQLPCVSLPVFAESAYEIPAITAKAGSGPEILANVLLAVGAEAVDSPEAMRNALKAGSLTVALALHNKAPHEIEENQSVRPIERDVVPLSDLVISDVKGTDWNLLFAADGEHITVASYNTSFTTTASFIKPSGAPRHTPQRLWYAEHTQRPGRWLPVSSEYGTSFNGLNLISYKALAEAEPRESQRHTWPRLRPLYLLHSAADYVHSSFSEDAHSTAVVSVDGKGI